MTDKVALQAEATKFIEDAKAEGHDMVAIIKALFAHPEVASVTAAIISSPEPAQSNPAPVGGTETAGAKTE